MTYPMPGPHDSAGHEGKSWFYACTACTGLWSESEEQLADEKRFTDAECTREWNTAEEESWHALADHIRGDKPDHAAQFDRAHEIALTWRRFAHTPHALENTP